MEWFRAYHGISSDPKWRLIARKAKEPVATVVAVWLSLLDHASQANERGSVKDVDAELLDCSLDLEDGTAQAILDVMDAKGVIHDGRISAWNKRQPLREDTDNPEAKPVAQRVREYRARKKAEAEQSHAPSRDVTQGNACVTQCNAPSRDVTQGNAPEQIREEETREETHTPLPPSQGGGACVPSVPLSGEDIAERQDGARQERKRGDYEFSLLRDAYDKARQEGPMAGRQEFLSLFHSPEWPGIDELIASVDKLCAEDDQFRRGFAPGLAKFLREGMWRMQPRAPAGEREPEMTPERQEQKRRHMEERRQFEEKMAKLKKQKGGSCG